MATVRPRVPVLPPGSRAGGRDVRADCRYQTSPCPTGCLGLSSSPQPRSPVMSQALSGVRVLELARYQAGPRGGMIMSDLGAEVIKIERLGGEETRKHAPMVRGQSVYFSVYN